MDQVDRLYRLDGVSCSLTDDPGRCHPRAPSLLGSGLRAAKVQIDGVNALLDESCRRDQSVGVAPRQLCNQRPIGLIRAWREELRPKDGGSIGGVRDEAAGVQHLGVAEVRPVLSAQQAERQVAAADHRGHHPLVSEEHL